ncbi:MAG: SLOG domain-containing protein [Acidimicrobiales bacterium]
MSIFILNRGLTSAPASAASFLEAAVVDLELGVVCPIESETAAFAAEAQYGDGVAFANPEPGKEITEAARAFLEQAESVGAVILPVAMSAETRDPPPVVSVRQSHDVVDSLRRRDLPPDALTVAAHEFSRIALARILPTMALGNVRLFLCHRRFDGEELAAAVDKELSKRHSKFFRDLVDIQVGEPAQEIIDEHLQLADVVVFFDTPAAGESVWVARELATALGRGIPVLWIRTGPDGPERLPLPVQPSGAPHINAAEVPENLTNGVAFGEFADRLLTEADVLNRASLRKARETFARIRSRCRILGRTIETLDARQQIYAISEPEVVGPYPRRKSVHVVQLFARHPTAEDQQQLTAWLAENDFGPHAADCRAFDAAVMLDPLPGAPLTFGNFGVSESAADYLGRLQEVVPVRDDHHDGTMLLLGAFPSGGATHQGVIEAVQSVAVTWLQMGGKIICGGHPTFIPLLTEAVRSVGADRDQLTVYWSRFFVTPEAIDALLTLAVVIPTEACDSDPGQSLTTMRLAMVGHSDRAAVVGIGGRTSELGTHVPGLDEEVRLARAAQLPVYLLGAAGGHTGQLARDAAAVGWTSLGNPLSDADNLFLAESDRYETLARIIWSGHG